MSGREELTAQERFARRLCQNVCDLTGEPRLLVHGEMSALLEQSGLADLLRREREAAEKAVLNNVAERMQRANDGLLMLSHDATGTEQGAHLRSKAEGMRVAASYVDEAIRRRADGLAGGGE